MNEYKVGFSYQQTSGARPTVFDEIKAATAQEAVTKTRDWYSGLTINIESVQIDQGNGWEPVKDWA